MKAEIPFNATPEFKHFKEVMREVLAVPKKRLDELILAAKEASPRKDDPHAPGQRPMRQRKTKRRGSSVDLHPNAP